MIDGYNGPDLLWLNRLGTMPEAAILRKGQPRKNAFQERKRFDAVSFLEKEKANEDEVEIDEVIDPQRLVELED